MLLFSSRRRNERPRARSSRRRAIIFYSFARRMHRQRRVCGRIQSESSPYSHARLPSIRKKSIHRPDVPSLSGVRCLRSHHRHTACMHTRILWLLGAWKFMRARKRPSLSNVSLISRTAFTRLRAGKPEKTRGLHIYTLRPCLYLFSEDTRALFSRAHALYRVVRAGGLNLNWRTWVRARFRWMNRARESVDSVHSSKWLSEGWARETGFVAVGSKLKLYRLIFVRFVCLF